MITHQMLDRRSLALHRLVAAKIVADPALLDVARATLVRWKTKVAAHSMPYLDAWQQVLDSGLEPSLAFMVEETQWATAMRQSSPCSGLLTARERNDFLRSWKARGDSPGA